MKYSIVFLTGLLTAVSAAPVAGGEDTAPAPADYAVAPSYDNGAAGQGPDYDNGNDTDCESSGDEKAPGRKHKPWWWKHRHPHGGEGESPADNGDYEAEAPTGGNTYTKRGDDGYTSHEDTDCSSDEDAAPARYYRHKPKTYNKVKHSYPVQTDDECSSDEDSVHRRPHWRHNKKPATYDKLKKRGYETSDDSCSDSEDAAPAHRHRWHPKKPSYDKLKKRGYETSDDSCSDSDAAPARHYRHKQYDNKLKKRGYETSDDSCSDEDDVAHRPHWRHHPKPADYNKLKKRGYETSDDSCSEDETPQEYADKVKRGDDPKSFYVSPPPEDCEDDEGHKKPWWPKHGGHGPVQPEPESYEDVTEPTKLRRRGNDDYSDESADDHHGHWRHHGHPEPQPEDDCEDEHKNDYEKRGDDEYVAPADDCEEEQPEHHRPHHPHNEDEYPEGEQSPEGNNYEKRHEAHPYAQATEGKAFDHPSEAQPVPVDADCEESTYIPPYVPGPYEE